MIEHRTSNIVRPITTFHEFRKCCSFFSGDIELLDLIDYIPPLTTAIMFLDNLHEVQKSIRKDYPILPSLMVRSALSPYTIEPLNQQVFSECQQFCLTRLINFCQKIDSFSK